MRSGLISATLAVVASVAAIPSPQVMPNSRLTDSLKHTLEQSASDLVTDIVNGVAPALPLDAFNTPYTHEPVPLEEAKKNLANYKLSMAPPAHADPPKKRQSAAKCGSLRIRREWDNLDDNGKQSFINAVKCLMSRPPSGKFSQAKSRYEDLVALHQTLTPQWHGNAMFPAAHRAFLFLTETMLRNECGYTGNLPWFDEARHAGSFASSSLFSTKWLGSLAINGQCVRDGVSCEQ
jgi:tyrosinase